jgi:putative lipoic acid-binding regulatory protein
MSERDREGWPQLDYPCEWGYRVIAGQEAHIRLAVQQAFAGHPVKLGELRRSSGGRWCSMSVDTTVENDEQRLTFFEKLRTCAGIRLVL